MYPPNTELTISMITNRSLVVLENDLSFSNTVNSEYSDAFGVDGAKIGAVINIRKPAQYIVSTGPALQVQSFAEQFVPLTLTTQAQVSVNFTTTELLLNIDEFQDRVLKPAIAAIANKIDSDGTALAQLVPNFVGIPGVTPNQILTYLLGGVQLDNNATPDDGDRSVTVTPLAQATMVDALKGLYNPQRMIGDQNIKGAMGNGFVGEWYKDQNVWTQTIGALGGTPVVNLGGQTGSSININGCTGSIVNWLNQGDKVQFAGVFAVNVQSKAVLNTLQGFTLTAPASTSGGGATTLQISPAIVTTGAYQNVSAAPINGAAVLPYGLSTTSTPTELQIAGVNSPQSMLYHKNAFTVASVDMFVPRNVEMGARASDKQVGFSIRILRNYDIQQDGLPCRVDVLYGWQAIRPQTACVILG
jgi:hypothetical protein